MSFGSSAGGFSFGTGTGQKLGGQPSTQPQNLFSSSSTSLFAAPTFGGGGGNNTTTTPALSFITASSSASFGVASSSASLFGTAAPASSQAASSSGGFSLSAGSSAGAFSFTTPASSSASSAPSLFNIAGFGASSAATTTQASSAAQVSNVVSSAAASGGFNFGNIAPTQSSSAAATSFSFGTGTGTVQTSAASAAASAAATGFSFGSGNQTIAASSQAVTSGFNFGAAAGASGTADTGKESVTKSATDGGKQNLSVATSAASNAFAAVASASAVVANTMAASVSVPSDIKDLSLDEVVNKWTDEVADLGKEFQKAATMVSKWDRAIVTNEDKIVSLHKDAQALKIAHTELSTNLDVILSQQTELHNLLDALETDVQQKIGSSVNQFNMTDQFNGKTRLHGDVQREAMHKLSVQVMEELDSMTLTIRNLVLDLNKGRNVSAKDTSVDTVSQIVSVLNAHLDSLQYLDESSGALQKRLIDVSRACEVVSRETERMHSRRSTGLY